MKTLLTATLAAALAGCASMGSTAQPSSTSTSQKASASAGPTDPQIAAIVVSANTVDVNNGKLARERTQNPVVLELAEQMIKDHTAVNQEAVALVTRLNVTPEENDTSRSLAEGGAKNVANLKTMEGASFDKAYVDNEVAYHEAVIKAVDGALIPNAKNEELKALLVQSRPTFEAHLEHAKHVQAYLKKQAAR